MNNLFYDLRFAFRRLGRRPGFTVVALLSIALGVGANSAVFTLVNSLLLSGAPMVDEHRLVKIFPAVDGNVGLGAISYPELRDIREGTQEAFSGVVAVSVAIVHESHDGANNSLLGSVVSGEYFDVLGIKTIVGRSFQPEEYRALGSEPVVILASSYWQRRFGGDPNVVGQTLRLNGRSYTVVGVAPEDVPTIMPGVVADFWAPDTMTNHLRAVQGDLHQKRGSHSLFVTARLQPGVNLAQAEAALDRVVAQTHRDFPDYEDTWSLVPIPSTDVAFHPLFDGVLYSAAGVLIMIVGGVLLVACVNLAAFLLAQAADRRREIALRLALGAQRSRLVRQLVTESALLGVIGGVAGLLLSFWVLRLVSAIQLPVPIALDFGLTPDLGVVALTMGVALLAGLVFGLVPALQTTRPQLTPALKDEATGTTPRKLSLRNGLVVAQVALSFVLLVGSGLFLRSLSEASAADPGFGHQPTAITILSLLPERYTEEAGLQYFRRILDETRALPGVQSVALVDNLALGGTSFNSININVAGFEPPAGLTAWDIDHVEVSPGFFETASVDLLAGRGFSWTDEADGEAVAIVNEVMVDMFWPGRDPLGLTFTTLAAGKEHRIVGVARNTDVRGLGETPLPYIYSSVTQTRSMTLQVLARTARDPQRLSEEIVQIGRRHDPDVVVISAQTMEDHLSFMLFPFRVGGQLLAVFGVLAVVLTSIGLYGVVSYSASARTREVGVRLSLGASRGDVVGLIVRGGLGLVAIGAVLGCLLALVGTPLLASLLFGVGASDPLTFAGVAVLMLTIGLGASLWPALRSSRIDPVRALKYE